MRGWVGRLVDLHKFPGFRVHGFTPYLPVSLSPSFSSDSVALPLIWDGHIFIAPSLHSSFPPSLLPPSLPHSSRSVPPHEGLRGASLGSCRVGGRNGYQLLPARGEGGTCPGVSVRRETEKGRVGLNEGGRGGGNFSVKLTKE